MAVIANDLKRLPAVPDTGFAAHSIRHGGKLAGHSPEEGRDHILLSLPRTLSVVVPAYNEEDRIGATLDAYARALQPLRHEIIVEVDGTSDHTVDRVREVQQRFPSIRLLESEARLGKGRGVLTGIEKATGDWVAYVDADGSVGPDEFLCLAGTAASNGFDAVIGSRYWDRDRVVREYGLTRWTASRGFNFLVRHLFGLPYRDTQCGAKLLRREAANAVIKDMRIRGFAFDVELLWRLQNHGFKVAEVPIRWTYENGSSVRLLSVASRMFLDVVRLRVGP